MCITLKRLIWMREVRDLGYEVVWSDAYFAVQ